MATNTIKPPKRFKWLKRFLYLVLICIGLLAVVLFTGITYINDRLEDLPVIDAQYLATYEPSQILDQNGAIIWKPTEKRIDTFTYDEIPEFYEKALITIEDEDYWTNKGFSVRGVTNMVYSVIRSKIDEDYIPRGGSTIDQQLIKNHYYNGGRGYDTTTRKIQEIFFSVQLNDNFTKEEILTYYVNGLEFAEGSIGVKTIMNTYFGKSSKDYIDRSIENIAEQAYIAGLSQAPTRYNIYENPEEATYRMKVVLATLLEKGVITDKEHALAVEYDLTTNLQPRYWEAEAQHEQNLKYKVYTDGVITELENMGYNINDISLTVKTYLDPDLLNSVTDLVRNPKYYLDDNQQASVAVVNSEGIVVALVGARNPGEEYNRALQPTRSSGSTMKPFTAYGPLLQYFGNSYNTASLLDTSTYRYPGTSSLMRNAGGGTYGSQPLMSALRLSYNTPVGRIDDEILGSGRMKAFLHGLGLDVKDTYSAVDGIGLFVSPLQNAAAYNTLNNLGVYTAPRFIESITFSDGSTLEVKPTKTKAMNESTAWVLNHILAGVPGSSLAPSGGISSYKGFAGKTGSVKFDSSVSPPAPYGDGSSDVWYSSYSNGGYAISVWCGYDIPNTSPKVPNYYRGQQEINRDLQLFLNGDYRPEMWPIPEGVKHLSGEGLNAHYQITDASDIGSAMTLWPDIDKYVDTNIDKVLPNGTVPDNWESAELSEWFKYYKENGTSIPNVIDDKLYSRMRGE